MAAHQVFLQLADLVDGDVRGGKLAEAGGHAVGHLLVGDHRGDDVVGGGDALARGPAEGDLGATACYFDHVAYGERSVADDDDCH